MSKLNKAIDRGIEECKDIWLNDNNDVDTLKTAKVIQQVLEAMKKSKHNPNTCEIIGCNEGIEYLKAKEPEEINKNELLESWMQERREKLDWMSKAAKLHRKADSIRECYNKWKDKPMRYGFTIEQCEFIQDIWNVIKQYYEEE